MRILKPEIAEDRRRKVLQWVIHRFIKTAAPVSSKMLAQEAGFKLSPATLRNVLNELEEEGYLAQEHASSGRVPTDKGYRLYVDYLAEMRRLASDEKVRIESEYRRRVAELDALLVQTSRMLSSLSHSAGFALSPKLGRQPVQRIEVVPLGPRQLLVVLVTQTGLIRHFPLEVPVAVGADKVALLGRFLNENLSGMTLQRIREELFGQIEKAEREFRDLGQVARSVLDEVSRAAGPEEIYVEGASALAGLPAADPSELKSLFSVLEDRRRLARIVQEEFDEQLRRRGPLAQGERGVQVRIGDENLPELRNLSLVTTTYELNENAVGLVGILGPRHMEYPKMMALVRFVGTVVSETLRRWEAAYGEAAEVRKLPPEPSARKKRA